MIFNLSVNISRSSNHISDTYSLILENNNDRLCMFPFNEYKE